MGVLTRESLHDEVKAGYTAGFPTWLPGGLRALLVRAIGDAGQYAGTRFECTAGPPPVA